MTVDFYMGAEQTILVRQSRWATNNTTAHTHVQQYVHLLEKSRPQQWNHQAQQMERNKQKVQQHKGWSTCTGTKCNHQHFQESMVPSKNGNTSSRRTWDWWDNQLPQLLEHIQRTPQRWSRTADLVSAATTDRKGKQMGATINRLEVQSSSTFAQEQQQQFADNTEQAMALTSTDNHASRFSIPLGTRSIGYLTRLLKPTFDMKQLWGPWGDIFTMGIWAQQVWTRQWTSFSRISENSSYPQRDKRTTTTTPSAVSWTNTKLQSSQNNDYGVLQSDNSIQQTETTDILKCVGTNLRWRIQHQWTYQQ